MRDNNLDAFSIWTNSFPVQYYIQTLSFPLSVRPVTIHLVQTVERFSFLLLFPLSDLDVTSFLGKADYDYGWKVETEFLIMAWIRSYPIIISKFSFFLPVILYIAVKSENYYNPEAAFFWSLPGTAIDI